MALVPLSSGQRTQIGTKLASYVQAGLDTKGRMPQWWERVQKFHRNERPESADAWGTMPDDPGYSEFHVPFSQPRQDMLVAQVCTVINKQEPYMLAAEGIDEGPADKMQQLVHRLWQDAKFEDRTRKAGSLCTDTDMAIWRLTPADRRGRPAVAIDVIDPANFICFPATPYGVAGAACSGMRIYQRRRMIMDKIKADIYYEATVSAGDDPTQTNSAATNHAGTNLSIAGPTPNDDSTPECWDLIVKLAIEGEDGKEEGEEKTYRATIAYTTQELLSLEEYPYSIPWFFVGHFVGDSTQFWSGSSVGRNLAGMQDAFNKLHSALYVGSMNSAQPAMIGPKLGSGVKYSKYKWADYIESDEPVQPFTPTIRFVGEPLINQLAMLEQSGDQVARISQNTQGAQTSEQTTATESSIIAAGVAVGLEEYIANFSEPLGDMATLTVEIIAERFTEFEAAYGEEQPQPPAPEMNEPMGGLLGAA